MTKKRNLKVMCHRIQLQIINPLLQFTKMTHKQLFYTILIGNIRDMIPTFCLFTRHHARHVQTKKYNNSGYYVCVPVSGPG